MTARLIKVDPELPEAGLIAEASAVLIGGGLVAFPTETVYGLGAHALDGAAVARLFAAKGRPSTDPVILHIASADDVEALVRDFPPPARAAAERFWPGPLTLILPKRPHVPDAITAGLDTVGIRVPAHPVAQALLRASQLPVAAPSANRFSRPSPTRAEHVIEDLADTIDLVLDAGSTMVGVESTVVDLSVSPPVVRRPGGVTLERLREVVPDVIAAAHVGAEHEAQRAPGQLGRHYAPRAKLTLYLGDPRSVVTRIAVDARMLAAGGARVGVLAPEEDLKELAPSLVPLASTGRVRFARYGARRDRPRAARELFDALRRLDGEGVDEILASAPEAKDIGVAILDRLTRAADGRIRRS